MPNFSFQRSSTPMPYSFGKPALNCCGGSLSTLGNMKRPVAASAAAEAAAKAAHDRPIQARRHGEDEAEVVVGMFANDVDAARRAEHAHALGGAIEPAEVLDHDLLAEARLARSSMKMPNASITTPA